jgi:NAD(P)-dependent dehydrogenase (short-subunit alcohol dehydrogenase family)
MANSKDVVVTGVSTGIGWGTTKVLVSRGFRVFGSVRKQADADRLQSEFGIWSDRARCNGYFAGCGRSRPRGWREPTIGRAASHACRERIPPIQKVNPLWMGVPLLTISATFGLTCPSGSRSLGRHRP